MYHSSSQTSKSSGVSIIFSKQTPWKESKVITDEEGRLLIVKGTISQQKVTLMNVYLPNEDQVTSLKAYLQLVHQHREGILVIGGDLIMVWDTILDTSKGSFSSIICKITKSEETFTRSSSDR